ncbi:MAG: DJ-1/PfpI family protein [Oscillospiraceae bacterium]|nr:DJ-1/PfpI family protein [Oscillospiraceae bacterium]
MSKVLCCFAPGLEECEGLVSVDLLRRAGIDVTIASAWEELRVVGAHGIAIECDALLSEVDYADFDALLLPGGMPGTENLFESEIVRALACDYAEAGRIVAAICAAPTVLGRLGLLKSRRATCYSGCEDRLFAAEHVDADTVRDGNIITGRALGAAIPFALEVIAALEGQEAAQNVKSSIVYNH